MQKSCQKRILLLGNSHLVIFRFRGELIRELIRQGYEVWVCFPNGPFGSGEKTSQEYGCHFIECQIDRRGLNPLKDFLLLMDYLRIINWVKPDAVLTYTIKPDIYGGIICRLLKLPYFPNITGLGKALDEQGILQKFVIVLYRWGIKDARCVFFQNESDRRFFKTHQIGYQKGITLPGSGVNLKEFVPLPYPLEQEPIRFLYAARVMKAKGIEQYLEAAYIVKQQYADVEFHICGYCEEDYQTRIQENSSSGIIIYHGLVSDASIYEKNCHCVVLPSFHPEGVSNVLLEGAAHARPLITTDHTGCRETVIDGVTGLIVKPRDSVDLAKKMIQFIKIPYMKKVQMGREGRKKMEIEYDRQIVVNTYLSEIAGLMDEQQRKEIVES